MDYLKSSETLETLCQVSEPINRRRAFHKLVGGMGIFAAGLGAGVLTYACWPSEYNMLRMALAGGIGGSATVAGLGSGGYLIFDGASALLRRSGSSLENGMVIYHNGLFLKKPSKIQRKSGHQVVAVDRAPGLYGESDYVLLSPVVVNSSKLTQNSYKIASHSRSKPATVGTRYVARANCSFLTERIELVMETECLADAKVLADTQKGTAVYAMGEFDHKGALNVADLGPAFGR